MAARDLLATESSRLRWRPISRALGVIAVLAVTVTAVVTFVKTGAEHPFGLTDLRTAVAGATGPFALAGFALGASLLGADIPTRAFTTLLTWEPRRIRVLAARATVCACLVTVAVFALSMLLTAALLPATRAEAATLTRAWLASLTALAVRGALLAAATSVIGMAAAGIGRSTAAAFAAAAGYFFLIEQGLAQLAPAVWRWMFVANAATWVNGSGTVPNGHSMSSAGLILAAWTGCVAVLAALAIEHRDIA